ncbi:GNAT family N-acetyltransferase [Streptomyces sp. NPDC006733]|uniref:GNAT family N-acetyltransferase n=1 Tax=Streptomyces sp. NPDC006733 TaxID=3155460 RepID=UPI0033DADD39
MDNGRDIRDDRAAGRLGAWAGDEPLGRIDYFVLEDDGSGAGGALVAVHTVVEPEHQGEGVAGALAEALYELAAAEGRAVVPLCPYVAAWSVKHADRAPQPDPALTDRAKQRLSADPDLW